MSPRYRRLVADSADDASRELLGCLDRAMDRQDMSTFDELVSPRVVVEVGSSAPTGLDEWRADLEPLYRGFPDGHHEIEELLVVGSHGLARCRFVGSHTGEFWGRAPTAKKVSVGVIHLPIPGRHGVGAPARWTFMGYSRSSTANSGAAPN
jgi:predicted ester cyclase